MTLVVSLLMQFACVHPAPGRVDRDVLPILPAPRGAVYTRGLPSPSDPLVAAVVDGLHWTETLSGAAAAAGLAQIGGETLDICKVRWFAVLAGYPYPVEGWLTMSVPKGELPDQLLVEARSRADRDVGLVRARAGLEDLWVLVLGTRGPDFPLVPRELQLGQAVNLGSASWRVSDPLGNTRVVSGALELQVPGEWMIAANKVVFPLYVGEAAPERSPLSCALGVGTPEARVDAGIAAVRATYGYDAVRRDSALDSVARAHLRDVLNGGPVQDAREQLRAAGYLHVPLEAAVCRGASVEACFAQIWSSPEDRGAIVGDLTDYGSASAVSGQDVVLVILGAG